MDRGISSLISGMISEERKMDVLSNNLANVSTAGFKRQQSVCSDFSVFMKNAVSAPAEVARKALMLANRLPNQAQDGTTTFITTDFEDGPMNHTGNMLDLAIEGNGFFAVETPDGIMYTRNGQFMLNSEGYVVTREGYPVLSDSGPFQFEDREEDDKPRELKVDKEGNIFDGSQNLGRLRIGRMEDPTNMVQIGDSLFVTADGQELADAQDGFTVSQGYVEESNVSAVVEMARMIETSRFFETYQKIFQIHDQLVGRLIEQHMKA